ncbi:MAG TPA: hypothetical protein VGQ39_22290 [Pyrinomonadaceae bacterium]|jgi:hypothetical protein|nr:hypothetical protein [Pyrinomonadaceae bacterium]
MSIASTRTKVLLVLALALLALPVEAQVRRGPRGRIYTRAEVNELIKTAEDRSDRFMKLFDKALDKSVLDGTQREDRLNERVKDFEKAMDKLRKEFDKRESFMDTKPQMQDVLTIARDINAVMLRRNLRADVEEEWAALRRELNVLASVYYLPGLRAY